jgi:phosphopantothenoylcysteine decarboxylase/phosphopantothenate--cysteine ligase
MLDAVRTNFPWCSALVMAAAIADFGLAKPAEQKIKKSARGMSLELVPIADVMPALASKKGDRILIGFAAETQDLEANAVGKLARKKLDFIVANDVTLKGAGFGVDTNIVTLINADGSSKHHPKMTKDEVADLILDRLAQIRKAGKSRKLRAVF